MGDSLSLECSYAVSRAPTVPCARRWAVSWAGQRVGSGRLKAPNIALPSYRNDSQYLKVLRAAGESLQNFCLPVPFTTHAALALTHQENILSINKLQAANHGQHSI